MSGSQVRAELEVASVSVLAGGAVEVTARLHNGGVSVLRAVNAGLAPYWPVLMVVRPDGAVLRLEHRPPGGEAGFVIDVPPGAATTRTFSLASLLVLDMPGRYQLRAEYSWGDGEGLVTSAPALLDVRPVTPTGVVVAFVKGSWGETIRAVWLDAASDADGSREIGLSEVRCIPRHSHGGCCHGAELGVVESVSLGRMRGQHAPVPSVPPNALVDPFCIGWDDDEHLHWIAREPGGWATARSVLVPEDAGPLVGPLLVDRRPGSGVSRLTALFMRVGADETHFVALSTPATREDVSVARGRLAVRTRWPRTLLPRDGDAQTVLIDPRDGATAVLVAPWRGPQPPTEAATVASFVGWSCIGADALLMPNDALRGVVVLRPESGEPDRLRLATWTVDRGGAHGRALEREVPLPTGLRGDVRSIDQVLVAASPTGEPLALLCSREGLWFTSDARGVFALPLEAQCRPVAILYGSSGRPMVLVTQPRRGVRLVSWT